MFWLCLCVFFLHECRKTRTKSLVFAYTHVKKLGTFYTRLENFDLHNFHLIHLGKKTTNQYFSSSVESSSFPGCYRCNINEMHFY